MKEIIFMIAVALLAAATVFGQNETEKLQKAADSFASAYNEGDYALIAMRFNAEMKKFIPNEKLKDFLSGVKNDFGKIIKLGSPVFSAPTVAKFPVEFENGKMSLHITLDAEGKIAGFSIYAPARPTNVERSRAKFVLPFKGEWFVVWGGDTPEQNYHQDTPNQRFAFDILKTGADGKTHRGDGSRNEDYYAFGQEIVAPADGEVIYKVDGVQDNRRGEMNGMFIPGNTIVIKHADGEYSLFAHFKQNSIRVKVGDKIKQGQTIGLCGNSGNSSEPHLHFQTQTAPFFADEATLKTFFEKINVRRDGKTEIKTDYSPVKGDLVSQN